MFNGIEIQTVFRQGGMDLLKRIHIKGRQEEGTSKDKKLLWISMMNINT